MRNSFAGLKRCLGLASVTGQGVASIGLTGTVVVNIPAIYQSAGMATWVCYAVALAVVMLVALVLNFFTRSTAGPGALAVFVELGFGPRAGILTGLLLALTYGGVLVALVGGFADNALALAAALGLKNPPGLVPGVTILCLAGCWLLVRRGVRESTILMLGTEAIAVVLILVLCVVILFHVAPGVRVFELPASSMSSLQLGLTLAILSFTGFESAATLGGESLTPQRTIPRAIVVAPLIAGVFFLFAAFVLGLGFRSAPAGIAQADNAVELLAGRFGLAGAGAVLAAGGCICFFGAALAILTALARILYFLGSTRVLPTFLSRVHPAHQTPHVALAAGAFLALACALAFEAFGVTPFAIFSLMGSFATCGFLCAYLLVALAAPFFLRREGKLTRRVLALCAITVLAVLAVGVASVYPPAPGLEGWMPGLFFALLATAMLLAAAAGGFKRRAE
jgi:amino acid transporter